MHGTSLKHRNLVEDAAKEWEKCNIKFIWSPTPENSDVRIAFNTGRSYSKAWIEAKSVDRENPTMELIGKESDKELKRHVLHEFGHMLGARHEHFSPHFPYKWNRQVVESYWEKKLGNRAQAVKKVKDDIIYRLQPNEPHHFISKEFDEKSIMTYCIEKDWLLWHDKFKKQPKRIWGNYHLTSMDIQKMTEAYST